MPIHFVTKWTKHFKFSATFLNWGKYLSRDFSWDFESNVIFSVALNSVLIGKISDPLSQLISNLWSIVLYAWCRNRHYMMVWVVQVLKALLFEVFIKPWVWQHSEKVNNPKCCVIFLDFSPNIWRLGTFHFQIYGSIKPLKEVNNIVIKIFCQQDLNNIYLRGNYTPIGRQASWEWK